MLDSLSPKKSMVKLPLSSDCRTFPHARLNSRLPNKPDQKHSLSRESRFTRQNSISYPQHLDIYCTYSLPVSSRTDDKTQMAASKQLSRPRATGNQRTEPNATPRASERHEFPMNTSLTFSLQAEIFKDNSASEPRGPEATKKKGARHPTEGGTSPQHGGAVCQRREAMETVPHMPQGGALGQGLSKVRRVEGEDGREKGLKQLTWRPCGS